MKISQIGVYGLFDRFDHEIEFSLDEPITIMLGPNGFGKTMILRILNTLFNSSLRRLERLPFQQLKILFDDSSALSVNRIPRKLPTARSRKQFSLELEYSKSSGTTERVMSDDVHLNRENLPLPTGIIEDLIPELDQITPSEWRNVSTDEILDLDDVVAEFGEILPSQFRVSDTTPAWLVDLKQSIPVRFIGTERLTLSSTHEPLRDRSIIFRYTNRPDRRIVRTVSHYSDNLAKRVQETLTKYATLSQSLDRTFPVRLVEEPIKPVLSTDQVRLKLTEVEKERFRIVEAGLLGQEHENLNVPDIESADESTRGVLAVYAQDALHKLSIFDDLRDRVNAFTTIANKRFRYKKISVSTDGLTVAGSDGSKIELEMLSSGEQHELVLLYDLLFGTAENSLIMIDEPELSLHVDWQREILSDLLEMAKLSNFHVLLATHSPQIIGDNWNLVVQLRGPDEK